MSKFEKNTDAVFTVLFGCTFIGAIIGVLFFGAWWHLLTAIISLMLGLGFFSEYKSDDGTY